MSNGGSRLIVPMTALRIADIPSNAARLLPKPMLPNAAKTTRMIIRRQKRMSTWVDLSSRGRFGTCAKVRKLRRPLVRGSAEIVAADRLVERVCVPRDRRPAGAALGRRHGPAVDQSGPEC